MGDMGRREDWLVVAGTCKTGGFTDFLLNLWCDSSSSCWFCCSRSIFSESISCFLEKKFLFRAKVEEEEEEEEMGELFPLVAEFEFVVRFVICLNEGRSRFAAAPPPPFAVGDRMGESECVVVPAAAAAAPVEDES